MTLEPSKRIVIVAGEASGDMHGSRLVQAVRRLNPGVSFAGIGGQAMKDAGVKILFDSSRLAVVGVSEVMAHLLHIIRAQRIIRKYIAAQRPDLIILIDYPDFNLFVAAKAKKLGIPVLYYISPQLWAWRSGRVKKIKRTVSEMLVILPFEVDFYRKHGLNVSFVGHPLLDTVSDKPDSLPYARLGLDPNRPVVGLFPGSRIKEITNLMPCLTDAAAELSFKMPDVQFVIPLAPSIDRNYLESFIRDSKLNLSIVEDSAYDIMRMAQGIVAASGTVTLEAAIVGVPMVIVYKISRLSFLIGKALVNVPYIGLVNLVAQRYLVPELVQDEATGSKIAQELLRMLTDKKYSETIKLGLAEVRMRLGEPGASDRAAQIVSRMVSRE